MTLKVLPTSMRSTRTDGNFRLPRPAEMLEFTGERMTSAVEGQIEFEHYHRYCLARDLCDGRDVLDVASGEGYGTALLATVARSVTGVEIDAAVVAHAEANYQTTNLRFLQGDALALPLPDATVDVVVSFETLEHVTDHERFIGEVRRVLRPGGIFVVSTPDRTVYSASGNEPNPYHVLELTEPELCSLLHAHFAHASMIAQRPVLGSLLASLATRAWRSYERRGPDIVEATNGLARAHYVVAIATDGALPEIPSSIYLDRRRVYDVVQDSLRLPGVEAHVDQLIRDRDAARLEAERTAQALAAAQDRLRVAEGGRADAESRLIELKRERDATRAESDAQVARLTRDCETAQADAAKAADALATVLNSTSWRLLARLRQISGRHPRMSRAVRRAIMVVWWTSTLQIGRRFATWRSARAGNRLGGPVQDRATSRGENSSRMMLPIVTRLPFFDDSEYLRLNADARHSGIGAKQHYVKWGWRESRPIISPAEAARVLARYNHTDDAFARFPYLRMGDPAPAPSRVGRIAVLSGSKSNYYMGEIADHLAKGLSDLGGTIHRGDESFRTVHECDHVIVVAPHEFFQFDTSGFWHSEKLQRSLVILNTEQLQTQWFALSLPHIIRARKVIDLNYQVASMFQDAGLDAFYYMPGHSYSSALWPENPALPLHPLSEGLPEGAWSYDMTEDLFATRPIDITFVGNDSPIRSEFFSRNASAFASRQCHIVYRQRPNTTFVQSEFTEAMPQLNAAIGRRSKILLNIHRDAIGYFEWARIVFQGISQRALVVTNPCLAHPVFKPGEHFLQESLSRIPKLIDWLLTTEAGQAEAERVRTAAFETLVRKCSLQSVSSSLLEFLCRPEAPPQGKVSQG